ncbi:Hypp3085 [Branchiostoma lanceolatum]|uniref:Hypp3085 protein n=1 Tax=Branchiostoma lanceolatum TaxID=7740 RepID=A0A8K0ESY2_BRALA|nr:Hypp3085 [Branchiostoma lanceolatum]
MPHDTDFTHLCNHAWEEAGSVKIALGGDSTLKIVPMGVGKPQIVAVVMSDVTSSVDRNTYFAGRNEMKNVTCFVRAWEQTYRHVFTTSVSGTPGGPVCEEVRRVTYTTREPQTHTAKVTLDQTNPSTTRTETAQPGKERSPHVGIVTILAVVGVVLIVLLVTYIVRNRRCCSRGHPAAQAATGSQEAPLAVISLNRWMIGGENSRAVDAGQSTTGQPTDTGTQNTASSGDDPQYSEIPDEHFNYYNTRPWVQHPYWEIPDKYYSSYNTRSGVQHPYWNIPDEYYTEYYNTRAWVEHPYWEIPDEYFNYENTRPQSFPPVSGRHHDDDDTVRFYAAAAEVALPSSTRLGGRHPAYGTATRMAAAPNNYQSARQRMAQVTPYGTLPRIRPDPQIPVRQRMAHVRPYGTLPRIRPDPQIPVRQRMAHVRPYGTLPRIRPDPRIPVRQRMAQDHSFGSGQTHGYLHVRGWHRLDRMEHSHGSGQTHGYLYIRGGHTLDRMEHSHGSGQTHGYLYVRGWHRLDRMEHSHGSGQTHGYLHVRGRHTLGR